MLNFNLIIRIQGLLPSGPRVRVSVRESRYCLFKFTQEPLKEPQGPLVRLPTLKTSRTLKYIQEAAKALHKYERLTLADSKTDRRATEYGADL